MLSCFLYNFKMKVIFLLFCFYFELRIHLTLSVLEFFIHMSSSLWCWDYGQGCLLVYSHFKDIHHAYFTYASFNSVVPFFFLEIYVLFLPGFVHNVIYFVAFTLLLL